MTVYVDDMNLPATVPNGSRTVTSTWCHLTADTKDELHAFAEKIGLRKAWFQDKPHGRWHYDVTRGRRAAAVLAGAVEVSWEDMATVITKRPGREGVVTRAPAPPAEPGPAPGPGPILLAVDGNSLLHRLYWAKRDTGLMVNGRPAWAVRGLCSYLLDCVARFHPGALVVGFDDPNTSVRRRGYPAYKDGRDETPADLTEQLGTARDLLDAAGIPALVPDGWEADDVLATAATAATAAGWRAVAVTSDRDAFAIIRPGVAVLRIINGGVSGSPLLTEARLPDAVGYTPAQWRDRGALVGDKSDNLPGVNGVGEVIAGKLLAAFGSAEAAFAAAGIDADWTARETLLAAAGKAMTAKLRTAAARGQYDLTRRLMTLHDTLPLGLPPAAGQPGRLPLDAGQLAAAFAPFGDAFTRVRDDAVRLLADPATARPDPATPPPAPPTPAPEPPPDVPAELASLVAGPVLDTPADTPTPAPAVTPAVLDPYHCMTCGDRVRPAQSSLEQGIPTQCMRCWEIEEERRKLRRGR